MSETVREMRAKANSYPSGRPLEFMLRWADEFEAAEKSRDKSHQMLVDISNLHAATVEAFRETAKKREAEIARLRAALEWIDNNTSEGDVCLVAREALNPPATATEKGGAGGD